ncbi:3-oxoadipate enol-lactonase [Gemmobacter megaterium]|uniref:3-oxoadipate enol-lactonase n=1 Tax=Gemmobacter megaterium TaxID=1086013 RepID=A0A1N7P0F3_9RHOB|nr:3-oxoadipate enol-lactonase [Gemmobacter megaterium]GGE15385.1 3-oxoadipate enol-lactonase [Gemmobacter megaterium]SIT04047.1 3-oxoadipate enol-lactonase [Gemmobacter megaterium]
MDICDLGDIRLHWRQDGDPAGAPVVFANSLGTDLRLWDKVIPLLPQGYRYIRYDMRGHGLSDCPPGPYAMGALVRDAERLLDALSVKACVFVGLSIGGMIAQGLAVKRLDLVRAMVISNTAAKIGTAEMWQARISAARAGGLEALAEPVMERWFSRRFRQEAELAGWRNMLTRTPLEGYVGCCAAIAGTDFYTPTSGLTLPTLAIAGSEDGSTPADLVRETADLIRGAEFHLIRGAGHLPCVEAPDAFAARVTQFLERVGHMQGGGCGHDHHPHHGHHH